MKFSNFSLVLALAIGITSAFPESSLAAGRCQSEKSALGTSSKLLNYANRVLASRQRNLTNYQEKIAPKKSSRYNLKLETYNAELEKARRLLSGSSAVCPEDRTIEKTKEQRKICLILKYITRLEAKITNTREYLNKIESTVKSLSDVVNLAEENLTKVQSDYAVAKSVYDRCQASLQVTPTPTPTPSPTSQLVPRVFFAFEESAINTEFPIGQGFSIPPVSVLIKPFYRGDAEIRGRGATVVSKSSFNSVPYNPNADHGLMPGNVNAEFKIQGCATKVSFEYYDGGGYVNLGINGELGQMDNLSEYSGYFIGGVKVLKNQITDRVVLQDSGRLELYTPGTCIRSFTVGGQELIIDNVLIEGIT